MRPTEPGNVQTRVAGRDAELRSLPRSSLRQWQELVSLVAGRENRKRSLSFANGFFVGLFLCLGLLGLRDSLFRLSGHHQRRAEHAEASLGVHPSPSSRRQPWQGPPDLAAPTREFEI